MQVLQQLFQPIGTIFNDVFYQPVYNILMLLYGAFHNILPNGGFALAIVTLTLILRACLIPLTRKQLKSSRAMQELQPKLKELQARYKNNPQELMAAQQALYKEHGVNPVSGCLPLLIQMPFIYALYGAFRTVIYAHGSLGAVNKDLYPFVPHLTHLPDTFFFWTSLATPDPTHILPVIAAILTFLQLRMALPVRKPTPAGGQKDSMTQATGMMQYMMPVMTLVIGLSFPAGLALYWCVSTLFSALQQYFLTGVGSLFVGIPGLEHLVPAPKETPTATPAKALAAGSVRALTAPAPAATAKAGGGLRGMLRQMKEQMSAAQQNALAAQNARQNGATPGKAQNAAKTATDAVVDADAAFAVAPKPSSAPRRERPRGQKASPVLVKPATTAAEDLPEAAIARDASGPAPFEGEPLPEVKVASTASNGNGNGTSGNGNAHSGKNGNHVSSAASSGKNGNSPSAVSKTDSGKNGNVPAASGARRTTAGVNASSASNRPGGQRKSSGSNSTKGSQSARPRSNGRPKGGR